MELEDYGLDKVSLQKMYEEWQAGASKSDLERRYLGKVESHGKLFSSLVRRYLGVDTEKTHPMVAENASLKAEVARLRKENERLRRGETA